MKAIGGYFELELSKGKEYHPHLLKLNTGRNCLEYLLRTGNYKKLYLPCYSCKVLLEPLNKLKIEYEFYDIDRNLDPIIKSLPKPEEAFLYINYFGIKNEMAEFLKKKISNLILDNSQAFFSPVISSTGTFYSARKFFGVPDGAYLATNKELDEELVPDHSDDRCSHLLKRIDYTAEYAYSDYQDNNRKLSHQPILHMSKLTQQLLNQIDYASIKKRREENFSYLHKSLSAYNQLRISNSDIHGPMIYPLYIENDEIRQELIKQRIFVATYWPNVLQECSEDTVAYQMAKNLLALPIDQRYSIQDMNRIIEVIQQIFVKAI
ncbi:DegT/DnrJ/EryC1/StrS aminotransferase family protein [Ancylomarina longa]|uniref:DegT/DnrJ/EryC1/StrS aminotransferase family protein n=1 Tax=Ancylomarina longa TaxID=2487017 RepID=A0A434ATX5_9BACT|nr:DegT/DnrJ/EryC1/StrS aminotransferase family protein [Ancylomarina longa]RUT77871.1 DegT/DnrJ/EryC1/StrS aminotransferase family protein [Ancylomarina longa]